MRQFFPTRFVPSITTTALWALAFGSCVFWGLRLSAPPAGAPFAPAARSAAAAPDAGALARTLGAVPDAGPAPSAPAASRFVLLGVLAGSSHGGAALLAVDGQPAKTFRVGSVVAPGFVLASVSPRRVVLGADGSASAGAGLTVEMPALR
ncbi:general secretion pathway protein C [Xylophilus sp. Kf1]|nr:general secretion pathway protein C [Xylophilus sp. Kf1]